MPLSTVDVFSGIGGISLGIQPFTKTVLYCEKDQYCQQVLYERMQSGDLHKAPIHSDIRNLCISSDMAPVMLAGGFPCQDVSSMGQMKGISGGERSGLFYEMIRIVEECPSIKVLFLENVANITSCGLVDVITELVNKGFNMQWMMRSASSQGAPHVRNRWFCLAVRADSPPDIFSELDHLLDNTHASFSWDNTEPSIRVSFKPSYKEDETYDTNWISRCQTLGNAVVPSVVQEVFVELVRMYKIWKPLSTCFRNSSMDVASLQYPVPDSGLIVGTKFYTMPGNKSKNNNVKHNIDITVHQNDNSQNKLDYFPTPRRGITHASSLTERSIRDLPTVLLNSTIARKFLQEHGFENVSKAHSHVVPNVRYIEWMMGFKADWTKVKIGHKRTTIEVNNPVRSSDEVTITSSDIPPKKQCRTSCYNGMHMLMKEHPGKGIMEVVSMWRAMDPIKKEEYCAKAKEYQRV